MKCEVGIENGHARCVVLSKITLLDVFKCIDSLFHKNAGFILGDIPVNTGWHDIRKDPGDLPETIGTYDCWARWREEDEWRNERLAYGPIDEYCEAPPKNRILDGNKGFGNWYGPSYTGIDNIYEVIAWRKPSQFAYKTEVIDG